MERDAQTLLRQASHELAYELRLYVTGSTPRSTRAIANIRAFCEKYLPGRHRLEVIDLYQRPLLAVSDQIIAAPTLFKRHPPPTKRIVGDLSEIDRVIVGLGLWPIPNSQSPAPRGES